MAEDYYERHERPKHLWVRALDAKGFAALRAEQLPVALTAYEVAPPPKPKRLRASPQRIQSLLDRLPAVPDPRDCHGRYQPWRAVLGIIVLAKLAGTHMGQRHIAELAQQLTRPQRRALRCLPEESDLTGYLVPSESTFQRALAALDFAAFEPLLLEWQNHALGPDTDTHIAIDGKAPCAGPTTARWWGPSASPANGSTRWCRCKKTTVKSSPCASCWTKPNSPAV